ncbi:hypothetical protein F5Y04DRAFT_292318 [Hypomontagnella monticulosa]|nr:hypothetical protein F5Y04DRAFT_292318 [Hypomontagnella monticulosa]
MAHLYRGLSGSKYSDPELYGIEKKHIPERLRSIFHPDDLIIFQPHRHFRRDVPPPPPNPNTAMEGIRDRGPRPAKPCLLHFFNSSSFTTAHRAATVFWFSLMATWGIFKFPFMWFPDNGKNIKFIDIPFYVIVILGIVSNLLTILVYFLAFAPSHGTNPHPCGGFSCRLARNLLGEDRLDYLLDLGDAVGNPIDFFFEYNRGSWATRRNYFSRHPISERTKLLDKGFLIVRLARYDDYFTSPRFRWLNLLYLAYWDWLRWGTAVLAYTQLLGEELLYTHQNGCVALDATCVPSLEKGISPDDEHKYLFAAIMPEGRIDLKGGGFKID